MFKLSSTTKELVLGLSLVVGVTLSGVGDQALAVVGSGGTVSESITAIDKQPIPPQEVVEELHTLEDAYAHATTKPTGTHQDPPEPPPGGPALIDAWRSADQGTIHTFCTPLPEDFFGVESRPYSGTVSLVGVPLGMTQYGEFGDADTLIQRSADPFDPGDPPQGGVEESVDVEIVALHLESSQPIMVTYAGDRQEQWTVEVTLSDTYYPGAGQLRAVKTDADGGTYVVESLPVQPRFTFRRVTDSQQVVFDTGHPCSPGESCAPQDPIQLASHGSPTPWVHHVNANLGLAVDPNTHFHPGVQPIPDDAVSELEEEVIKFP